MNQNYIKLYSGKAEPDSVYLLNEGNVYFFVSEMDKYVIRGKNLIIGASELILGRLLGLKTKRLETAVTDRESKIKKISADKFIHGMNIYSFALNTSIVIAKQVLLTNNIIHSNINELTGKANRTREILIEFYLILAKLREELDKRKLQWLKEIISDFETTLSYKKGEAFYKSSEPTKISDTHNLSDKMTEYSRNSIICEENSSGDEMFILNSGSIDVTVNGNKVASIDEPGTVFGEMALLLGEKRTATLTAKNNVVISKISRSSLKEMSKEQTHILKDIACSLAKKHNYNIVRIESTNQSLIEKNFSEESNNERSGSEFDRAEKDLKLLKEKVEEIKRKKKADFLDDLVNSF
jgi:CRP-like cAMP-binding protein